jgi:hypothetical protein
MQINSGKDYNVVRFIECEYIFRQVCVLLFSFSSVGNEAKAGLLHAAMQPDQESESACTRRPGHWRAHGRDGPHPGLGRPC